MARAKIEAKAEKKSKKAQREEEIVRGAHVVEECPECDKECECCCGEPLTRHFTTYEGFNYLFKYGASQNFCGNTEQKYSVLFIPNWGCGDEEFPQCICVKRPMITGSEIDNRCFIDIEIGLSNFPLGTFSELLDKTINGYGWKSYLINAISGCLNMYRRELGKLDMGYVIPRDRMEVSITEPVSNGWGNIHLDREARLIVTIEIPWNDTLANDNILFVSLGMEFIRQVMAAANEFIYLHRTAKFKPDFIELFLRNIRHEIANGYYPGGFVEVIKFISDINEECDGECECIDEN